MPGQQLPRTLQPPPDLPSDPTLSDTLAQYLRTFSLWCRHGFADKLSSTTAAIGMPFLGFDAPFNTNPNAYQFEINNAGVAGLAPIPPAGRPGTFVPIGSVGVTDGSDAAPGRIGEVISQNRLETATVPLTTGVPANVCSIVLTPGDWDVHGEVGVNVGTGGATAIRAAISTVNASFPADVSITAGRYNVNAVPTLIAGASTGYLIGMKSARFSSNVPATYYLVVDADFTSGVCAAYGNIWARRMR